MNRFASVAVAIAIAAAAIPRPAEAGTFYAPAGPTGLATGTLTFQTIGYGALTCDFSAYWSMQGGAPRFSNPTLSGPFCSVISFTTPNGLYANPSPGLPQTLFLPLWRETGSSLCSNVYGGTFNNATSTMTLQPNSFTCALNGSVTFPGLILLP